MCGCQFCAFKTYMNPLKSLPNVIHLYQPKQTHIKKNQYPVLLQHTYTHATHHPNASTFKTGQIIQLNYTTALSHATKQMI